MPLHKKWQTDEIILENITKIKYNKKEKIDKIAKAE